MDILTRLDVATEALLEQNRQLKAENSALKAEKQTWQDDRTHLLSELERILKRLDDIQLEDS